MRPHRDSTPILLVLVCALFVLVAFLRLRDGITGRPKGDRWTQPFPLERLEVAGRQAVREVWGELLQERDDPRTELYAQIRSPVSSTPLLMARPVEGPVPFRGVHLRGNSIQVQVLDRRPFLPEDLPHVGTLRVEATYLVADKAIERSWLEGRYRLVRVGLPRPLGEHALVVTHPSRLADPGQSQPLASVRADLLEARRTLKELRVARRTLEEQARLVARRLVEYSQGFRHRGQASLEPPEAIAANWIDALPALPEPPPEDPGLEAPLVSGWQSVDLARWGRHPAWSERLRLARDQARAVRGSAWRDWRRAVERWFDPVTWSGIGDESELLEWVARIQREASTRLRVVGDAGVYWAALEVQRIQHHLEPEQFLNVLAGAPLTRLEEALLRIAPATWRAQARKVFEGEDAAARCGSFLEGIGAPFAKEFEGVLYVDNAGGKPLVLAETTVPGRLVVVATGDVRLTNLGPRDSAHHRVVVQAGGKVEVAGRVRASVLALGPVVLAPETHLVGGLVIVGPGGQDQLQGRVEWDPAVRQGDPLADLVVAVDAPLPASTLAEPQAGQ